jgi:hypothetical protein
MDKNELKFRAIGLMADRDQDVRLSNTVVECKHVKAGSLLTFGIDDTTGQMLRKQMVGVKANTHIVVCLVLDAALLDATVKELENGQK